MKVLLDPEAKVSEMFGVQGIPQTVLIGKDGKVQAVHVGFSPDLKERLSKELDSLIKGDDLAAKTLQEQEKEKEKEKVQEKK
jgi:thioredoxin-like negative regulator of GroEL